MSADIPPHIVKLAEELCSDSERLDGLVDSLDKDLQNAHDDDLMPPRAFEVANIALKLIQVPPAHLAYMLSESVIRAIEQKREVPWASD